MFLWKLLSTVYANQFYWQSYVTFLFLFAIKYLWWFCIVVLMKFEIKIPERIPAYLILIPFFQLLSGPLFALKKNETLLVSIVGFIVWLYWITTASVLILHLWEIRKKDDLSIFLIYGIENLSVDISSLKALLEAYGKIIVQQSLVLEMTLIPILNSETFKDIFSFFFLWRQLASYSPLYP